MGPGQQRGARLWPGASQGAAVLCGEAQTPRRAPYHTAPRGSRHGPHLPMAWQSPPPHPTPGTRQPVLTASDLRDAVPRSLEALLQAPLTQTRLVRHPRATGPRRQATSIPVTRSPRAEPRPGAPRPAGPSAPSGTGSVATGAGAARRGHEQGPECTRGPGGTPCCSGTSPGPCPWAALPVAIPPPVLKCLRQPHPSPSTSRGSRGCSPGRAPGTPVLLGPQLPQCGHEGPGEGSCSRRIPSLAPPLGQGDARRTPGRSPSPRRRGPQSPWGNRTCTSGAGDNRSSCDARGSPGLSVPTAGPGSRPVTDRCRCGSARAPAAAGGPAQRKAEGDRCPSRSATESCSLGGWDEGPGGRGEGVGAEQTWA